MNEHTDEERSLFTPSKFWKTLGDRHDDLLNRYGIEHFKRYQALRYFTWQWRWRAMPKSDQARFLLLHSRPASLLRSAIDRSDLSDVAWTGVPWPRSDRWLYVFASRLIWEYARRHGTRAVLDLEEPLLGDPLPVRFGGRLVSQDLANCALETAAILRGQAGRTPTSVVEVGAGYGRTAYTLLSLFPNMEYTVIDIDPAIRISEHYLTQLFPGRNLRFLTPDRVDEIDNNSISLAVSISSLQEMRREQVLEYLTVFDRILDANGTIYLKQWAEWFNPEDHVTMRFVDYPVPAHWTLVFREDCPVQTRFQQAVWQR